MISRQNKTQITILIFVGLFLTSLFIPSMVRGQLREIALGYRFEESGFLSTPGPLTYDASRHRLAIADRGPRLVYIFDLTDKTYQTLGVDQELLPAVGLAFDPRGNLYIALDDIPNLLIYEFQSAMPDTMNLSLILPPEYKRPERIAIGSDNTKYIIDRDRSVVYMVDLENKYIGKINEKLKKPDGVGVTKSGEILIADKGIDPILIYNPSGIFERRFSRPEAPTAQIGYRASGLAIDQLGWIYTLDLTNNKVIIYDPTGVSKTEWAPDEQPFFPADIVIDRYDHIFISEGGTGRVITFEKGN